MKMASIVSILILVALMGICTWIEYTFPENQNDVECYHCYDDDMDCGWGKHR
jgi:hypothetical protein